MYKRSDKPTELLKNRSRNIVQWFNTKVAIGSDRGLTFYPFNILTL